MHIVNELLDIIEYKGDKAFASIGEVFADKHHDLTVAQKFKLAGVKHIVESLKGEREGEADDACSTD